VPSLSQETDGLTAVAGMAAGRPILATDNVAMRGNLDSESGWLISADPSEFAAALQVLDDRDQLSASGRHARLRYLDTRAERMPFVERAYAQLVTEIR
jgi:glycosyltransferase involved in cell wall biosynthesis